MIRLLGYQWWTLLLMDLPGSVRVMGVRLDQRTP
jgi:hypothetical protein